MNADQMWNEALAQAEQIVAQKELEEKFIKSALIEFSKNPAFLILIGGILPPDMTCREMCKILGVTL